MRVFARIARTVKERPWTIIAMSLVLSVLLGLGLLFLKGDVTYYSILPKGFPSIKTLDNLRKKFGGIAYESILIRAPSVTDSRIVQFLVGLGDYLGEDPRFNQGQIQTVKDGEGEKIPVVQDYLTPFIANMKTEMATMGFDIPLNSISNDMVKQFTGKDFQQLVKEDYLSNPQVKKSMVGKQKFVTPDYKAALVMIKVGTGLSDKQQIKLANDLDDLFRSKLGDVSGIKINIGGDPTLARDFDRHIRNKTIILFVIAIAFVIIMLFLSFRRFTDTLLPVAFVVLGLVWTFGFTGWVGIPYSVAAIAIMPLLLGTALTFVVPLVARYYEEMEHHFRSVEAVGKAVMTVGVGIFLAATTNVFGFLVFKLSVLPPLKDFGITCAAGTVFIFGLSVTLLPAIMAVRDRSYEKAPEEVRAELRTHFDGLSRRKRRGIFARVTDRVLEAFSAMAVRHSLIVIIGFTLLILLGFVQIRSLKTDSDLRKLAPRNLPGILADFEIEKYFGGRQQDVIMAEGDVLKPESLEAMVRLEDAIADDKDNIYEGKMLYPRNAIVGLPDVLTEANNGRLPATRAEAEQAVKTAEANGGYVTGGLLSGDGKAALITLNSQGAQSPQVVDRKLALLKTNSEKYLTKQGLQYELGGITPITKDMTKNIIPTETLSSILSLILCALILIVIFRSFPYGLITLTVAFAGVAAEIGFLQLMNWPLDTITSLSSALVIGIGVNFGILFTHRYLQEMELGNRLPVDAIKATMMNLGRANVVAALATVAAFVIIMLSDIVPLRRFGGVTAFAIGWCLVTSLTLMPALLYRLSGHREAQVEKAMPEVEPEKT
ncbi:MAG: MMPL family transporter [Actinobacteria bacterium]|nr:MMPL family transporter [Actinomycetota bacterium]